MSLNIGYKQAWTLEFMSQYGRVIGKDVKVAGQYNHFDPSITGPLEERGFIKSVTMEVDNRMINAWWLTDLGLEALEQKCSLVVKRI
jgi:hypothetical protein